MKPLVLVTMGDPTGVGPEVCVLALSRPEVRKTCRAMIIGDARRLAAAGDLLSTTGRFRGQPPFMRAVRHPSEARFAVGEIDVIDLTNVPRDLNWGELSAEAGAASFAYVERAVALTLAGEADAVCTAPINKEAWRRAGLHYPGHTEAVASLSGGGRPKMMLVSGKLRVVHVSTHISLREAIDFATTPQVLETVTVAADYLQRLGISHPRIAVAGLNPHAGEGGLFGNEEEREIRPAVELAIAQGIAASGPWPSDSVFAHAAAGAFDAAIALYHDQGHIAVKMLGRDNGVNVTIGLRLVRTSVDHGTAFDIAGKGLAREESLVAAIAAASAFKSGG